jgi:hypothetical protein
MVDLVDGNYVDEEGDIVWVENGKWHRLDGPAIIRECGQMQWRQKGKYHRTDGPAGIYNDGTFAWCLDGIGLTFEQWLEATTGLSDEEKVMLKLKYG